MNGTYTSQISRIKLLNQLLIRHHLLTTQRTKRVQTQTIKYQKRLSNYTM